MTIGQEITNSDSNEYSSFGKPYEKTNFDPVDSCLPGNFLDYPKTAELGLCHDFMTQRCSTLWDNKCSIYSDSLNDQVKRRSFFKGVAIKKYCRLTPDSNCTTMCQPLDPIAQESVSVCKTVGSEPMTDINATIDIGWYRPVSISPDYMGSCDHTCDRISPNDIKEDDIVVNTCLKYGHCNDILTNVCDLAERDNIIVSNTKLSSFCGDIKQSRKKVNKTYNKKDNSVIKSDEDVLKKSNITKDKNKEMLKFSSSSDSSNYNQTRTRTVYKSMVANIYHIILILIFTFIVLYYLF
jgi:hypothetical protein